MKAGHLPGLHGAGVQVAGIHAAQRHLGRAIALGPDRPDLPAVDPRAQGVQHRIGLIGQPRLGQSHSVADGRRKPRGQDASQRRSRRHPPRLRPHRPQFRGNVMPRRKVDPQAFARLPKARDLQDHRPAEAAMGEQQRIAKASAIMPDLGLDRDTRQGPAQRQILFRKGQRHQPRAGVHDPQPELPGDVIGEAGRADLGDGFAARRHHHARGGDIAPIRFDHEARAVVADPAERGVQPQLGALHPVQQHPRHLRGLAVAEKLPLRLFVPGDPRALDQAEKLFGAIARQGAGGKARVLRQEPVRRGGQVGEIAPPAARDADLFGRVPGMVQHQDAPPLPAGRSGAKQPGRARAQDDKVHPFHQAGIIRERFTRKFRAFSACAPTRAWLFTPTQLGRGQVVRHRFLVPCTVGSNPTAPASIFGNIL